ncbi:MAG: hypothetical protein QW756_08500 [Nitrososphaerota archaeon]
MTGIAEESGPERMLKFIRTIAAKTSHSGTGFIATINPDSITPVFSALIQELFHGVLELQVTEEKGRLIRRVRVVKMPGIMSRGSWIKL